MLATCLSSWKQGRPESWGVGGGSGRDTCQHDRGKEQVVGMRPSFRILLRYKLKPV